MVTYVDADAAPLKNTGQIRLYGREAFDAIGSVVTDRLAMSLLAGDSGGFWAGPVYSETRTSAADRIITSWQ